MYKDLNDYELLYMVSEDENNFDILYSKYQPLIYKMVKNYTGLFKKYGYDLEDLMQIGYITLYRASYLYKGYDRSLFYTYFVKSLKNALNHEIRLNTTLKKEILNNSISYDKLIDDSDKSFLELIPDNKKSFGIKEEPFILFKSSMSFMLGNIFELYINGYSFKEISMLLDYDIKKVRRDFSKIKQHALTYKTLFFE